MCIRALIFVMEQVKPLSFHLNSSLFLTEYFIFTVGGKKIFFGVFLDLLNPSQRPKPYLPIRSAQSPSAQLGGRSWLLLSGASQPNLMRHYVDFNVLLRKALFILRTFLIKDAGFGRMAVATLSDLGT